MTAALIASKLRGHRSGSGWVARCPAHEDKMPSLSVTEGADGRVLVHCHAGCPQEAVVAALKDLGLWPRKERAFKPPKSAQKERVIATYPYTDEAGKLLYEIVRFEPKNFRQRYPDGSGGWVWKKNLRQVLYRLQEVLAAPIVFVVGVEKDVETLRDRGSVSTTAAAGAA